MLCHGMLCRRVCSLNLCSCLCVCGGSNDNKSVCMASLTIVVGYEFRLMLDSDNCFDVYLRLQVLYVMCETDLARLLRDIIVFFSRNETKNKKNHDII